MDGAAPLEADIKAAAGNNKRARAEGDGAEPAKKAKGEPPAAAAASAGNSAAAASAPQPSQLKRDDFERLMYGDNNGNNGGESMVKTKGADEANVNGSVAERDLESRADMDVDEMEEGDDEGRGIRRREVKAVDQRAGKKPTRGAKDATTPAEIPPYYPDEAEECVQTFLYKPNVPLPDLNPYMGQIIEVRVPVDHLSLNNPAYQNRQLWGCDYYTSDSDIVCMLHHAGFKRLQADPSKEKIAGVSVYLKVTKGRTTYSQATRNGLRSRKWPSEHSHTLRIVRVDDLLDQLGTEEEIEMMTLRLPSACKSRKPRVRSSNVRYLSDIVIAFNLCNEPCSKYSLSEVCDRGLEVSQWTTYRLTKEVMYLETETERYELCQEGPKSAPLPEDFDAQAAAGGHPGVPVKMEPKEENKPPPHVSAIKFKTYRWSRVKSPRSLTREEMMMTTVPLPAERLELLNRGLDWTDIAFGRDCIQVDGKVYSGLLRVQFYPIHETAQLPKTRPMPPAGLNKDDRGMWVLLQALEDQAMEEAAITQKNLSAGRASGQRSGEGMEVPVIKEEEELRHEEMEREKRKRAVGLLAAGAGDDPMNGP